MGKSVLVQQMIWILMKTSPHISGVKEGLQQYNDIEQTTDLWSLNSGRVQVKMGVNEKEPPVIPASGIDLGTL